MVIVTESIGSIPRPLRLIAAIDELGPEHPDLDQLYEEATRDTIKCFKAAGSPVISDGEQRKHQNFWTNCVHGLAKTPPDGFRIPFAAGHIRRMPRLTAGPLRYRRCADSYLERAQARNFYVALAGEPDSVRVLETLRRYLKPDQRVFVGVVSSIVPVIESAEVVCERVLRAAEYIPLDQVGTTDDCGFSPFSDDTSTRRETAFAKIEARVHGTAMAAERLARSVRSN